MKSFFEPKASKPTISLLGNLGPGGDDPEIDTDDDPVLGSGEGAEGGNVHSLGGDLI